MCGIAGFSGRFSPDVLARMSASIAHRGPDDDGTFVDAAAGIGLAHRRLSIIDLSSLGHQPMWDEAGRVAITYNGEIYNFRELRAGLAEAGFRFRSRSDTEVLLNLYLRDGVEMFRSLNGIYAFAIWDSGARQLLLARDDIGVKPLYFAEAADGFLFASELKALLLAPGVDRTPDAEAMRSYLRHLWCPAPRTMLAGVKRLEQGHALLVRDGLIERHWRFAAVERGPDAEPMSGAAAIAAVRDAVDVAVGRQMVADVPVGAFLSGGLDSSAVAAFARRHAGARRLQCFTIEIGGAGERSEGITPDLPYARKVAAHLDVDLHTVRVGAEMADSLGDMLYHLDEPQADPAALNVLFIARLAREQGITVLLSGAGGDDIFSGYRRHRALELERFWSWWPHAARSALARGARRLPSHPAALRRAQRAFRNADLDQDGRIAGYFDWLDPATVDSLLSPDLRRSAGADPALLRSLAELPAELPPLERMLHLERKHFLADHNLNYTDKMSMASGVEVRVPLLDRDLVSLAGRLPPRFKQRGAEGKWVLKRAMEGLLPAEVIRRPKTGFGVPLRAWLKGPLRPLMDDVLSLGSLQRRGWFEPAAVLELIAADRERRVDAAYPLFAVLCMELWGRIFLDGGMR